jgi:Uma2 family endonuclease
MQPNAIVPSPLSFIVYPESDGKPLAESTKQLRWIITLYGNLAAMYLDRDDVFVAGDNFWYPVEGRPDICTAPDVYVAFGRPKGDRGSYKQWVEGNVPLTVVFEVLSPGNTVPEMADKLAFYDEHGVEEYYIYDPEKNHLMAHVRKGNALVRVRPLTGFVSPRLGIWFELTDPEMTVYRPDGERFLTFEELEKEKTQAKKEFEQARQETQQARQETQQARQETQQAEQRAGLATQRLARFAELSKKARHGAATADELRELEELEQSS